MAACLVALKVDQLENQTVAQMADLSAVGMVGPLVAAMAEMMAALMAD